MMINHKKKFAVSFFLAGCIVFGVAAYNPPQDPDFKNLQILPKNISHDSLGKVMDEFKHALGVQCTFCHVHTGSDFRSGWDFASDEKDEKNIARHMMKMKMEINSKFFNFMNSNMPDTINVVTCETCHRGAARPEDAKMAPGEGMKPPPPPPTPPGNN